MTRTRATRPKSVLVTGGCGFLGRSVVRRLRRDPSADVLAPPRDDLDLLDADLTNAFLARHRPEVVVHLAANVGGIGANQRSPATFWRDNLSMGLNVLEACRLAAVRRLVVVGTVCAYPKFASIPFRESELWSGYPEETNAPYGIAKRTLAVGLDAYRREFGLRGAFLLPANLYGPGDDFEPETSHVIAATIRKCVEAVEKGSSVVTMWGTGRATREFLFVDDAADAVSIAAESIDDPTPMNLGTGVEIPIHVLAEAIGRATGFEGTFAWDPSFPDGQPRRSLDVTEAVRRLGWRATTSLEAGLAATVHAYREHRGR